MCSGRTGLYLLVIFPAYALQNALPDGVRGPYGLIEQEPFYVLFHSGQFGPYFGV